MAPPKKTTRAKRTVTRKVTPKVVETIAATVEDEVIESGGLAMEEPAQAPPTRIKDRVPIGQRRPLAIDTSKLDPNYEYRNVRGSTGNLPRYIEAGYEFVTDGTQVGDAGIMRGSETDSRVSVPCGDSNDRLFLMRIPKEYYAADQALKQQAIDKKEEALKPTAEAQGLTGKIDISR